MVVKISKNRVDLGNEQVQNAELKACFQTLVAASSGSAYTVDLSAGNAFQITLTANCALTFSNVPASSGKLGLFMLLLVQDGTGSRTVTWPSSVVWQNGTAPTLTTTATATDHLTFFTTNAGATWIGVANALGFATKPTPPTGVAAASVIGGIQISWNAVSGATSYNIYYGTSPGVTTGTGTKIAGVTSPYTNAIPGGITRYYIVTAVNAVGESAASSEVHATSNSGIAGQLWMWGNNAQAELGTNDGINHSTPVQVGSATNWSAFSGGTQHTVALQSNGTLWVWGSNGNGQLGTGNTLLFAAPVQVGALTTWSAVSVGGTYSMALQSGTLWTWGYNNRGQLGIGIAPTSNRSSPVQVGGLTTWSFIGAGQYHALALQSNGTLWTWGYNYNGQLGQGDSGAAVLDSTLTNRSSPVQVGALTTWKTAAGGTSHSVALQQSGTLWAWGYNGYGQLGLGDIADRSSPVQVGALTTWAALSAGYHHTVGIKTDGSMWVWGRNDSGQLGLGTTTNRSSPVQLGGLTTWSAVVAGRYQTIALQQNGTVWVWGQNNAGQLGVGDKLNRSSPVQVGALTTWSTVGTFAGAFSGGLHT